jgi:hypothetical protein
VQVFDDGEKQSTTNIAWCLASENTVRLGRSDKFIVENAPATRDDDGSHEPVSTIRVRESSLPRNSSRTRADASQKTRNKHGNSLFFGQIGQLPGSAGRAPFGTLSSPDGSFRRRARRHDNDVSRCSGSFRLRSEPPARSQRCDRATARKKNFASCARGAPKPAKQLAFCRTANATRLFRPNASRRKSARRLLGSLTPPAYELVQRARLRQMPSFCLSRSLTARGLALPPVCFIT